MQCHLRNSSVTLFKESFDNSCSVCGALESLAKESKHLKILNLDLNVVKCFGFGAAVSGGAWDLLDETLLSFGWSSLVQINIKVEIRNISRVTESEEAEALVVFKALPETGLRRLSSNKSVDFKYSATVHVSKVNYSRQSSSHTDTNYLL